MTEGPRPKKLPEQLKRRARKLRRDSTAPEQLLWGLLRDRQLGDLKFRRQQVIGPYVVDFYCDAAKLVVELDGESHVGQARKDDRRTAELERRGVRVLRVTNDDVLQDLEAVGLGILLAAGVDDFFKPSPSGRGFG